MTLKLNPKGLSIFSKLKGLSVKKYNIESELPFFLLYLWSIAAARIPRTYIFKFASEKRVFKDISSFFMKIRILTEGWRYEHALACEAVGKESPSKVFRELLSRMARSIRSGEPFELFMSREYNNFIASYSEDRERMMGKLKHLSDAYVSVLSSATFICLITLMLGLLYSLETMLPLAVLVTATISTTLIMFSWVMFNVARPDEVLAKGETKPFKRKILNLIGIISIITSSFPIIIMTSVSYHPFYGAAFSGFPLLVAGLLGKRYVAKVKRCEDFYPFFLRQVASICAAKVPVKTALKDALNVNYGPLNNPIKRLYSKLNFRIDSTIAWWSFETEVDSELIRRVNGIFVDVLQRGGDVSEVSRMLESLYFIYTTIRRQRYQVVSYLTGIVVPLHIAMCGVMAVVGGFFSLLTTFSSVAAVASPITLTLPIEFIDIYFLLMIIVFSINNAITLYSVEGDSRFTLIFYIGLLLTCGSLIYNFVNQATSNYLFSILTG